jgi:AraC family ethanolamine operon transcriptional activator
LKVLAFADFEEYAGAIGDADLRMMLPRVRHPRWEVSALQVGSVRIQHGREGCGNLTEGAGRKGTRVVFLPAAGLHRANGSPLDGRSILVIEPRSEFAIAVHEPHTWYSVALSCDTLGHERLGDESCSRVVAPGAERVACIRGLLSRVVEAARVEPGVLTAPASVDQIEAELLRACRPVLSNAPTGPNVVGRPVIPRDHIIRSAIALAEQSPEFTLRIDELAAASDVSVRTLRTAFVEHFGIPPLRYLTTRRLHEARRALRAADPEATTVTAVATRFGFWQFGRFAGEYVRLFGERPSDTLRGRVSAG